MMLRTNLSLLLMTVLFSGLLTGCLNSSTSPVSPRDLDFAPLQFDVPEVTRQQRENGLRLYLEPDPELPLVHITAMLGVGSIVEPQDKTGLVKLYGSMLRHGGAGALTPDAMDEALEQMAADFSVKAETYAVVLNLSLQADDLERGLEILADVLRKPRFDPERLENLRRRTLEEIRRRNDDPAKLSRRVLHHALYGEHPLGRSPEADSVRAVTRDDLVDLHRRFSHPNNLQLGISGDFDSKGLQNLVKGYFDDWPAAAVASLPIPPVDQPPEPATWIATKDLTQTTILLGEVGITKDNPDQYAVRVMNYLLGGGGFNSRLMREIRSNRGLAYSVYSSYQVGRHLPGPFIAGSETRPGAVAEVVGLMQKIMQQMRNEPVAPEELALAKESLIHSFVFTFADQHDVVTMNMRLDYYDYPEDYLSRYRDRLAAVTREDVMRVAQRYLNPDRQALVLVGDIQADDPVLESLQKPVKEFTLD